MDIHLIDIVLIAILFAVARVGTYLKRISRKLNEGVKIEGTITHHRKDDDEADYWKHN